MCSQPMVQAAQERRATRRAAFSSSPDRAAAPSNVPCWKLRVGRAAKRLNVSRLATVPSSRYLAVAGPNDRCDRSRGRRHHAGRVGHLDALRAGHRHRLEPLGAHDRPEPAAAGVAVLVADRGVADQVLAGRADDRRVKARARAARRAGARASSAGRPHRSAGRLEARPGRRRSPARDGAAQAPTMTRASKPALLAARAKCDDDRASLSRSVSGDLATTANLAEVVSGVPTSGLRLKTSGASGASGSTPGGASRCSS